MLVFAALLACAPAPHEVPTPRGDCNPVDPAHCLLPFPSTFFLADGQVAFGERSLPTHWQGGPMSPDLYNERDGFPILGGAYTWLGPASTDGLVSHTDIGAYAEPDARTLWIDAETGERLPHWVELVEGPDDPDQRLLVLRPAVPMGYGRRYVIGLRHVAGTDGGELPAPEGFRLLRDGEALDDPDLVRQQASYDEQVFPVLEAAGVERDTLQMAWDLVTASEANTHRRMRFLRDEALDQPVSHQLHDVVQADCAEPGVHVALLLRGRMIAPSYLTDPEVGPGSVLTRDDDGLPVVNGEREAPFTMIVPCSVVEGTEPAPVLQFAHGLFHSEVAIEEAFAGEMADRHSVVFFAQRWTGMSADELPVITVELTKDLDAFAMIPERLHQGQLELLLGPRMVLGSLADDPLLTRPDGSAMLDRGGVALYATSQGSILGGATVALSPDLERAVLNVPGMPLSLVLPRASLFDPFAALLESVVEAPHDAELLVPLMGMLWEPVEAAGYAPYITGAPLDPGLPEKRVLLQAAIGDASVTTLGAHIYARATGAGLVQPDNRAVWGLQPVELPLATGSALLEIDYGQTEPLEAIPAAEDGDPHGEPIRSEPIQDQAVHFLLTGEVTETCDGACDPD